MSSVGAMIRAGNKVTLQPVTMVVCFVPNRAGGPSDSAGRDRRADFHDGSSSRAFVPQLAAVLRGANHRASRWTDGLAGSKTRASPAGRMNHLVPLRHRMVMLSIDRRR